MSKASASSNRSANSNGDSRPPSYRCAAEISAAPSLPSGSQASTQSESLQIPTRTRPTVSLNSQGHRFWLDVRKDWDNDATIDPKSPFELLLDWLGLPNYWKRFAAGSEGCSSIDASKQYSAWLVSNFRPTKRTRQDLSPTWETLAGDSTLSANPALAGFEQDLYAREAQTDATFTGGTTPAAPEDEETELMEEIREVEAYEKGAGESAHVEGNNNRYPEPDNGYCMSWAALDSDARAASGENVLHNG
nr:hypothetical protein L203_06446 [Cryptococcus depauperatus CBS 7841]